jgi:hypothetical protein
MNQEVPAAGLSCSFFVFVCVVCLTIESEQLSQWLWSGLNKTKADDALTIGGKGYGVKNQRPTNSFPIQIFTPSHPPPAKKIDPLP